MCYQEIQLLREAVFPYLLCAAAREGSIEALERLRQAVSQHDTVRVFFFLLFSAAT
jgi:hypothetical protein